MRLAPRPVAILALIVALLVPAPVVASVVRSGDDVLDATSYDTPSPTARPRRTPAPKRTPRPRATTAPAVVASVPVPALVVPARDSLTVAYRGDSVLAQAPLLLAQLRGYFEDAGVPDVTLVRVSDPLADVGSADADLAVVGYTDLLALAEQAPGTTAVAGYQNYAGKDGAFGGDALVARPGLIAQEPSTVIAFLVAYIRALGDLSDADAAAAALSAIEEGTDLAVDADVAAEWDAAIARYAPYDGGFGDVAEAAGLGELAALLQGEDDEPVDLSPLLTTYPLNIAQAALELPLNPASDLIAAPGVTEISIGLPSAETSSSPIIVADQAGYFEDAGFDSVEIVDVERALPGVMTGQLDFAVIDMQDAGDGIAQGLPLEAVAGHANYAGPDGTYGGDLIIVSPDLVDEEGATVTAFLVAYIRALQDLDESAGHTRYAPFDGGFGDRTIEGGSGELSAQLLSLSGDDANAEELVNATPLTVAQAWWGLPANPTGDESETTGEEAD